MRAECCAAVVVAEFVVGVVMGLEWMRWNLSGLGQVPVWSDDWC